jgi:HEAT repeat protein
MPLILSFLLCSTGPVIAEPDLLDRALRAIKMTRADVTLDKNYRRRDAFALKGVDEMLTAPLKLPDYAQQMGEELGNATTLRELIELGASRLEVALDTIPSLPKDERKHSWRESRWRKKVNRALPQAVAVEVIKLVDAAIYCNVVIDTAYVQLSKQERAVLFEQKDVEHRKEYPLHEYFVRHHRGVENVEKANHALFKASAKVKLGKLLLAAAVWSEHVENAKENLKNWAAEQKGIDDGILLELRTPAGLVMVTGDDSSIIRGPRPQLLIDLGGDDTYFTAIGGGKGCTAVIELAGDDTYIPDADRALGAGIHGASIFIDCEGDDRYNTRDVALGVGLFGVGIAIDEAGRDDYNAQEIASGVGVMGIGIQIDLEGHDSYFVRRMGQAASVTRGLGLLIDRAGNDSYFAGRRYGGWSTSREFSASAAQGFAGGVREYTSGGIALLLDLQGHDSYYGEAIAQGVGYWFALGMLIDGNGNDNYQALHYSQGSGFHFAVAGLFDNAGNDTYLGGVTCQGSGYDYSAGVMVDYSGNDLYKSSHLSSGSGGVTGMGFLFDNGGNDVYLTGRPRSHSLGGGQFVKRRGFGCIGGFIDTGGKDYYLYEPCKDNSLWTRAQDGVGLDTEKGKAIYAKRMKVTRKVDKPAQQKSQHAVAPLSNVEEAMKKLSNWRTKKDEKEQAVAVLKKNLKEAEPLLIDHLLAEPFYMSFGAAYSVIPQMGAEMAPALVKVFETGDAEDRVRALSMLGKTESPQSIGTLTAGLADENYRVRGTAALGLGRLEHKEALPELLKLLEDPNHTCRTWAAMALGRLKDDKATDALIGALGDSHYSVRTVAADALIQIGTPTVKSLKAVWNGDNSVLRSRAIETLARVAKSDLRKEIEKGLTDTEALVRASACRAAQFAGIKELAQPLRKLSQSDGDSNVRQVAAEAAQVLSKLK